MRNCPQFEASSYHVKPPRLTLLRYVLTASQAIFGTRIHNLQSHTCFVFSLFETDNTIHHAFDPSSGQKNLFVRDR